jgi:predicted NBD/HSP70 family sugar kinase
METAGQTAAGVTQRFGGGAPATYRGSNQSGMRAFNERLVLSLMRSHGALAKAEIARLTGLSAQTVSVIMRSLEADGLLLRGAPVRGRVGQPSVPMSLNPQGAYFAGLKVGRRSSDLVLVDFTGAIVERLERTYSYPLPEETLRFVEQGMLAFSGSLGARAQRIAGFGIAMPSQLWSWEEEAGAPKGAMDAWRAFDIREQVGALVSCPVYIENDATAACGAELAFGDRSGVGDFVYIYVGTFIGGGVVLNGNLYSGRAGNAGAIGSMPVPGPGGTIVQLIDVASLVVLERRLIERGMDPAPLWRGSGDWSPFEEAARQWIGEAARAIAHAVIACASVIDFRAAIIDGGFPAAIRSRLIARIGEEIGRLDVQGLDVPELLEGRIGPIARALGGASLPLFDRFLIDQHTLMREQAC